MSHDADAFNGRRETRLSGREALLFLAVLLVALTFRGYRLSAEVGIAVLWIALTSFVTLRMLCIYHVSPQKLAPVN